MNDEEQALSEKVDLMGPVFILLGNSCDAERLPFCKEIGCFEMKIF